MAMKETIEAKTAQLCALIRAGEAAKIADLYAENATLLAPGVGRIDGRNAIQEYYRRIISAGLSDLVIAVEEVEEKDGLAIDIGTLRANIGGGGQSRSGKRIAIWKADADSDLSIQYNIWNFDH